MIKLDLPYKVKTMENTNNFSIVLLTKNNEKNLPDLLKSLDKFKNSDINILDMGSTDDTIKIAEEWGCKVTDGSNFSRIIDDEMFIVINDKLKKDNDNIVNNGDLFFDYSGARDYAASLATNDMILMLDPKIYLIEFRILEINNYINNNIYTKINFTIHNKKSNICEFYNRKKYKWCNIVNEKLKFIGDFENVLDIPEHILRMQMTEEPFSIKKEKLVGLAVNIFLEPGNIEVKKDFAVELRNNNFINTTMQQFKELLDISDSGIDKSEALIYIGDCLIKLNNEDGLNYYHKAYLEYDKWRLPLYKLGEYFFQNSTWDKCIFYLEGCLNIEKPNEKTEEDEFIYKDGPYSMLYVAYWWFGDHKKGKFYFDKALEVDPYNKTYLTETPYHYEYTGNNINGNLTFQEIQYLYKESKKHKSILEIYPDNGRGTHALLSGCDGLITIILKNIETSNYFLENLNYPGNLRIVDINDEDIKKEKFDMIIINSLDSDEIKKILFDFELNANKLLCGYNYNQNKKILDELIEIDDTFDNIWYKNNSQFDKTIIYTRKNNF